MTKLFTRQGNEFTGTIEFNDAGKAVRYVNVACDRCHVINGQRLWIMGMENGRPYSKTGFDCWTCGNTGVRGTRQERLFTSEELTRANKAATTRAIRKAEADRVAAEQAQVALVAKEANFRASNAEFIAKLDTLDGEFWDGFKNSFYARREAPTERQIGLVDAEVAKRQKNAVSGFVGAVGDKVTLTITVERILVLKSEFYGDNYITIARDEQGNAITYKGRSDIGGKGDTVTIKASVKEHTVYNGIKQTVIQRPKVVEMALG
jgi:hypothetical protein